MNIIDLLAKNVTLRAKSKKGKERILRDGASDWEIKDIKANVQFSSKKGPWILVDKNGINACRWINLLDDTDFIVEVTK